MHSPYRVLACAVAFVGKHMGDSKNTSRYWEHKPITCFSIFILNFLSTCQLVGIHFWVYIYTQTTGLVTFHQYRHLSDPQGKGS